MKYMKYGIAFDVAHNDGVTIEKINFKNVNVGHFIEMDAACKNVFFWITRILLKM